MRAARAMSARGQRGFLNHIVTGLGALIVLAIAGRFAWWVATEEIFWEVAVVLWTIGFAIAYLMAGDDVLVAMLPAGFAVFLLVSLAGLPLTWLGESRVALLALIGPQLAFSYYAGRAITGHVAARVLPRYPAGAPAWLDQDRDIVRDLVKLGSFSLMALFFLLLAPLLALLLVDLVVDLPQQHIKWLTAGWGLVAITWFGLIGGFARLIAPMAALIYLAVTAGILIADAAIGPFAEGTGVQVAYTVLPGALLAAVVEVFVFGGARRTNNKEEGSA